MTKFKRTMHDHKLTLPVFAGIAACALATSAAAAGSSGIEEVVVTAQKVEESAAKVPLAVSALSSEQLSARNYSSLEDFKGAVPGLQVNNYVGQARMNIRGIGMNSLSFGADSQVAFSMNGVYSTSAFSADQAFLDIARVEIVRGPQGTLYGRNATGGAINIITKRPTDSFEASAQLKVGNHNEIGSEAIISGPIMEGKILGRLAVSTEDHSGYSRNLYNGKHYDDAHTRTARGTLVFNLSDAVQLTVIGDYHRENDGNYAMHLIGKSPGYPVITGEVLGGTTVPLNAAGQAINPRLLNINTLPKNKQEAGGVLADLTWQINDALSVRSISSWRKNKLSLTLDFDSTPIAFPSTIPGKDFIAWEGTEQFTQELQFIGDVGWMHWVTGLYYYHARIDPAYYWIGLNFGTVTGPFNVPVRLGGTTVTDAYAGYGQAAVNLTDKLSVTGGIRFSYEKHKSTLAERVPSFGITVDQAADAGFHDISPKISVQYQWTDGFMTYATVAKGFQAGGFDITAQPPLKAFQPETVWDYEAGAKYRNGWLSADLSAFHYIYSDLQVAQIVAGLPATTNAATSRINGVEFASTIAATQNLTVTGNFTYLDATFSKFFETDTLTGALDNLAGNHLPGSSRYATNLLVQYTTPTSLGDLSFTGEWNWHDRLYFTEFNSNQVSQPSVSTFNASVRLSAPSGKWFVELYGKNLSNERIKSQAWITGAGFGSMVVGQFAPPLTFGATLHYAFD